MKNLDKVARPRQRAARRAWSTRWDGDDEDIRELTNDLCLRTDGKIRKEDLDAIIQWP